MPLLDVEVQEVHDFSARDSVGEVSNGAAEEQGAAEGFALGRFGKPQIRDNGDGECDGEGGQDEGGEGSGVGEESECGAGVFHQHEPEKRQDADGVFRQRGREDDSLGREIQDENDGGDRHPEEELGRGFHCGEGGV